MIEWGSPWAFWLLIPVLLLPLQGRWTGRNRLAIASEAAMTRRLTLRLVLWWLPGVLQVAGLALVVVALARPHITRRDVVVESDGLDILLALDTSGSMDAPDFSRGLTPVSRLEVAKGVMARFVEDRPFDRIGLVVFGQDAFTFVPLTLDHDTLLGSLEHVQIGIAGKSATAVGAALAVAGRRMKQVDAPERVIILLTDGRNNVERPDPIQAAWAAAALDIRIYTIGIGSGVARYGSDAIDEPTLRKIADITGGQFFRASSTKTLQAVYETIDELETSPAEVRELVEHEELFRQWLIPGVGLLVLQLLLSATFLRRGP
ncbi:MAG: VWA domain-containing protein [Deltaproteobacteria bacterium]|nr:VWA domain-containing protein [Deltaproteobacteria bacterium]MBW2254450.1 VWA domain-containing protein [Deltaproteobacteria bacterium]